jgi:hypothetical protein
LNHVAITDEFIRHLRSEDDLGLVVRAHIHIEYELNQFIKICLPNHEELGRMEYSGRVRLALACGLRSSLKRPLKAIGKLRNDFAHQLGTTITEERVNTIYSTFTKLDKDAAAHAYSTIVEKFPEQRDRTLEARKARSRLIIYVVTLWAGVVAETMDRGDSSSISN